MKREGGCAVMMVMKFGGRGAGEDGDVGRRTGVWLGWQQLGERKRERKRERVQATIMSR
jgi:hypothetical protein